MTNVALAEAAGPETESSAPGEKFTAAAGFGFKHVDDPESGRQTFYTFNLSPDIHIGPLGLGLNLAVDIDHNLEVRTTQYDETTDYFNLIRYITWGTKKDDFYLRAGTLDNTVLGYGTIVNHFRTDVNWDTQKIGAEIKIDLGAFGVEGFTNDVVSTDVIGGRMFIRPLWTFEIPIISELVFGGTYVTDRNAPQFLMAQDGSLITTPLDENTPVSPSTTPRLDPDGNFDGIQERTVTVYGVDVGLPLIPSEWDAWFQITPFADYSMIHGFNSGRSAGVIAELNLSFAQTNLTARLERREYEEKYLGMYFDTFYEIERYSYPKTSTRVPKRSMVSTTDQTRGVFGELQGQIADVIEVGGSYLHLDEDELGQMTINASITAIEGIRAKGFLVQRAIGDLREAFTFTDTTFLVADAGYEMIPGLWLGIHFERSWRMDEKLGRFVPVDVITPGVSYEMSFGGD
ncbi:MAG: hypothetical protein NUW37_09990 [Planctomycetes bacterium]|nr:hypothetical protein [Planctomycetota bacterium]